jgi:hypothetical protein
MKLKKLLYHGPWIGQTEQFALLNLFAKELDMTLEDEGNECVFPLKILHEGYSDEDYIIDYL